MLDIKLKYNKLEKINSDNLKEISEIINLESLDSVLDVLCDVIYDSKRVEFIISGFGSNNWGMDCKFDLPCIIEDIEYISKSINNKETFNIDFYEQGRECKLEFIYIEGMVIVRCCFYMEESNYHIEHVSYNYIQNMFRRLEEDFIYCCERLVPEIVNNKLYIEWKNKCKIIV